MHTAYLIVTITFAVLVVGLLALAFVIVRKARPEDLPEIVHGLARWWRNQ